MSNNLGLSAEVLLKRYWCAIPGLKSFKFALIYASSSGFDFLKLLYQTYNGASQNLSGGSYDDYKICALSVLYVIFGVNIVFYFN